MIDRNRDREITLRCDECDGDFGIDSDDFQRTLSAAKAEGWRVKKSGSEWDHICPDCK